MMGCKELRADPVVRLRRTSQGCSISPCELCQQPASIYCPWDEANLCDLCDEKVHSANFLVARHTRNILCLRCGKPIHHSVSTGCRIQSSLLAQDLLCRSCTLYSNVTPCHEQKSECAVDTASTAESCCIDAYEDDHSGSSYESTPQLHSVGTMRRMKFGALTTSLSQETVTIVQEEGQGDSEDISYGCSSSLQQQQDSHPCKRRKRHR
ncbi:hypothetical protein KP509_04G069100 [Ceratopteris richardii]|uniref:B box-type domain-containing protein n=1 Tax=Ceratopteris richardii TaxID=49495 RepID=A0A8T2UTS8_CERRI|nr:hypothetical protein KP509_04G069100 [Ceratopteris richardii]